MSHTIPNNYVNDNNFSFDEFISERKNTAPFYA